MTVSPTFISNYKSYFIDDFCTNDKFKSILRTLLEIDDMNILLVGSSSSGKTTLLYAILREYYGLAKHQSFPENNLLFINSLKEQGINYYRNEMKTFCQSRCSIHGKKKMIVVDDIDMINEQCQQVFRNYIDKYKNNVHFISACSNVQKVIESIQSRIHILRIEPPTSDQIRGIMQNILGDLGLRISPEAQDYLLSFSKHSVRALINHIEKIYILSLGQDDTSSSKDRMSGHDDASSGQDRMSGQDASSGQDDASSSQDNLSLDTCKSICSNISFQQFENYVRAVFRGDVVAAIHIFYDIHDYGYSVIDILDYFYAFVKMTDLLTEHQKYQVIPLLCKYITIFHTTHEDVIELAAFTHAMTKMLGADASCVHACSCTRDRQIS